MFKLVKYSLRLLIVVTGLTALAQVAAAAGPSSSLTNPNAVGQVASQVDQQVVTGSSSVNDSQSTSVSSSSTNTTVVRDSSGTNDNGSGGPRVGSNNDSSTINQSAASSDPNLANQPSDGQTHSVTTNSSNGNDNDSGAGSATLNGGSGSGGQSSGSQTMLVASHSATPPTWSHVVMQPTNGILPAADPVTPSTNPYQPPVPTTPPINPLASTGMLLMFGQFGVSSSSFSTVHQASFNHFAAWPTSLISHFVIIFTPMSKTQTTSWLLLAAAMLGVGIVALWRRSGYSLAPRSHILRFTNFGSLLNQSLGVISPNSVFNYLCLPGGA